MSVASIASYLIPYLGMLIFLVVISLALFVNRRRLTARVEGKSNVCLSVGLLVVFLSALFVMPLGFIVLWFVMPFYSVEYWILSVPLIVGGLVVLGFGFRLVIIGSRNRSANLKK